MSIMSAGDVIKKLKRPINSSLEEWKAYQEKLQNSKPLNDKEWEWFQEFVKEQDPKMSIGVNWYIISMVLTKEECELGKVKEMKYVKPCKKRIRNIVY